MNRRFGRCIDFVLFAAITLASSSASTAAAPDWSQVHNFCYQLQKIDLQTIGRSHFDAVVIDYSSDGSDTLAFTQQQIESLKHSPGGPKKILAYISIGEAEDYRFYWDSHWKQPAAAPTWLGPQNPQWRGNYKVKYWEKPWQGIVKQYLDRILAAGYDGIYMDVVDAYEFWGPDGESQPNRPTAETEMVDFVKDLADYVHINKHRPDFALFAQGAPELASHPDYVQTLTGIGNEDNWYNGNKRNKPADTSETLKNLDIFRKAGKLVFVIDYVTKPALIDDFYSKAIARTYIPYATVRPLDKLTINPDHDPR